jgi:hypothetical protein
VAAADLARGAAAAGDDEDEGAEGAEGAGSVVHHDVVAAHDADDNVTAVAEVRTLFASLRLASA